jgi:hypothetical protein
LSIARFFKKNTKCPTQIPKKEWFNEFKIESITLINIWNDNINYKIIYSHCAILTMNTINNEQYDLQFDFVIRSHLGLNQKSQMLEDEIFTKLWYSMMMEKYEYHNLTRRLNEKMKKKLMKNHWLKIYPNP